MLWMADHEELGGVGGAEVLEEDDPGQHHHDEDQSGGEIPGGVLLALQCQPCTEVRLL